MKKTQPHIIRLWNPLFPKLYTRDEEGHIENYPVDLTPEEIVSYQEQILTAIERAWRLDDGVQGLAKDLKSERLMEKVVGIHPSVEEWENQLWGITEVRLLDSLTEEEHRLLVEEITGQFSDGWGEAFEQRQINTPEGELHISFWSSESWFFIKPEEEMLIEFSEGTQMKLN